MSDHTSARAVPHVTIEVAGHEISVPVRFHTGHVLTEDEAKLLDAYYRRQFANNLNGNAKNRVERLAKAETDEDRAANAPYTGQELADMYVDYVPGQRGSGVDQMQKIREEEAFGFWSDRVAAHNKAISAGKPPVIAKAGNTLVRLLKADAPKTQTFNKAHGKPYVTAEDVAEWKAATVAALLASKEYAGAIQRRIDNRVAAMESAKLAEVADTEVTVSSTDLINA